MERLCRTTWRAACNRLPQLTQRNPCLRECIPQRVVKRHPSGPATGGTVPTRARFAIVASRLCIDAVVQPVPVIRIGSATVSAALCGGTALQHEGLRRSQSPRRRSCCLRLRLLSGEGNGCTLAETMVSLRRVHPNLSAVCCAGAGCPAYDNRAASIRVL
jgi:hypothetical protein